MKRKNNAATNDARAYQMRRMCILLAGLLLIIVLLAVSFHNIVVQYYYAFVLRSEGTIAAAMEGFDPLQYTTEEKQKRQALQSGWDSWKNARLCDPVCCTAEDGSLLSADYYDNGSDETVIVLHGYNGSSKSDFLTWEPFAECNILIPDSRKHGNSGGTVCSFGVLEQYDLRVWLNWLEQETDCSEVILFGEDMGAVSALLAAEHGLLSERVSLVIVDSPYSSLKELADYSMKKWFKIPVLLTSRMGTYLDAHAGSFTVDEADLLRDIADTAVCDVPVLFLLGSENDYVPYEESSDVMNGWEGPKQAVITASRNGMIQAENQAEIAAAIAELRNKN